MVDLFLANIHGVLSYFSCISCFLFMCVHALCDSFENNTLLYVSVRWIFFLVVCGPYVSRWSLRSRCVSPLLLLLLLQVPAAPEHPL